jgi:hypothetical protein
VDEKRVDENSRSALFSVLDNHGIMPCRRGSVVFHFLGRGPGTHQGEPVLSHEDCLFLHYHPHDNVCTGGILDFPSLVACRRAGFGTPGAAQLRVIDHAGCLIRRANLKKKSNFGGVFVFFKKIHFWMHVDIFFHPANLLQTVI